ncbi:MAG: 3-deoxy-manno-octulosonate cytidylyltransferase [Candidatus Aminicenantes bacterium]|nr:3-deoxy-manno-octulosonate cytidylyltransferase [Candidatus Aminicenantes bacterium]
MVKAIGIIPARYASSRFPGKPLALLLGKPLLQWVYEAAISAQNLAEVLIATDDGRIAAVSHSFGAPVIMTRADHPSGTDRVAEVAESREASIIVNIQADEPLIQGWMIDLLIPPLISKEADISSLMAPVYDLKAIQDLNRVKVVVDRRGYALYFSRSPLPNGAIDFFYQHIGIYAYRREVLMTLCRLEPSRLEKSERLEQLRALENGYRIRMLAIPEPTLGVDTPEDLIKVEQFLKERN